VISNQNQKITKVILNHDFKSNNFKSPPALQDVALNFWPMASLRRF